MGQVKVGKRSRRAALEIRCRPWQRIFFTPGARQTEGRGAQSAAGDLPILRDPEYACIQEILTTTSSTEAKNTERLVELRKSINELTEQKLDAEAELQKFISENENLISRVKEIERENTNIKKTVHVNMEAVQSTELER